MVSRVSYQLLCVPQPGIKPAFCDKFFMCPIFCHMLVLNNGYVVGTAYGREPVGHNDHCTPGAQFLKRALYGRLRDAVERRSGFIQYEDGRILQKDAGYGYPLLLPAGQSDPPFSQLGIEPFRKFSYIISDAGAVQHIPYLFIIKIIIWPQR